MHISHDPRYDSLQHISAGLGRAFLVGAAMVGVVYLAISWLL
jgi:hypothetical protein